MNAGFIMPHPPIIIPDIGNGRESEASKTIAGCRMVADEVKRLKPEVIVVISPHGPVFKDALCINMQKSLKGNFKKFHSDVSLTFENNLILSEKICENIQRKNIYCIRNKGEYPAELDHGVLVPLYYITEKYSGVRLISITIGMLETNELYECGKL